MLSTVMAVAISVFLWPAQFVPAQLTCPRTITSLNGASPTNLSLPNHSCEMIAFQH